MQRTTSQQTHSENRIWLMSPNQSTYTDFQQSIRPKLFTCMQLRTSTSTITSASPGYVPLSRRDHTTNISSFYLQGACGGSSMKVKAELLQHPEGAFFLQHPCSSLQPSFKPNQDPVLLQNYKLMCESKLDHVCYSQEKILQRFSLPVKAEKASVN